MKLIIGSVWLAGDNLTKNFKFKCLMFLSKLVQCGSLKMHFYDSSIKRLSWHIIILC